MRNVQKYRIKCVDDTYLQREVGTVEAGSDGPTLWGSKAMLFDSENEAKQYLARFFPARYAKVVKA